MKLRAILLLLLSPLTYADPELDAAFGKDVLVVNATRFACHRFDIWLALDREQQMRGLMHVRSMPDTSGMLFVYREAGARSMWMKNTYIPLDIAFIRADGTIANVAKHTEPLSLKSIHSVEPVQFVLELNAGVTDRLAIDTNSRIIWNQQ